MELEKILHAVIQPDGTPSGDRGDVSGSQIKRKERIIFWFKTIIYVELFYEYVFFKYPELFKRYYSSQ